MFEFFLQNFTQRLSGNILASTHLYHDLCPTVQTSCLNLWKSSRHVKIKHYMIMMSTILNHDKVSVGQLTKRWQRKSAMSHLLLHFAGCNKGPVCINSVQVHIWRYKLLHVHRCIGSQMVSADSYSDRMIPHFARTHRNMQTQTQPKVDNHIDVNHLALTIYIRMTESCRNVARHSVTGAPRRPRVAAGSDPRYVTRSLPYHQPHMQPKFSFLHLISR